MNVMCYLFILMALNCLSLLIALINYISKCKKYFAQKTSIASRCFSAICHLAVIHFYNVRICECYYTYSNEIFPKRHVQQ